jgi:hypothetical protein
MSEPQPAKLAFLTQPSPGIYTLNLQVDGQEFYRLQISRAKLANIVIDATRMLLRDQI